MDAMEKRKESAQEARERKSPAAEVVLGALRAEGNHELQLPAHQLAISGLACGLAMGFSLLAPALIASHLPAEPWARLVSAFGYGFGFLIVVLGRQQLFTEKTVTPVLSVLESGGQGVTRLLRLWAVVLVANLTGAFLFAWFLLATPVLDATIHLEIERISSELLAKPTAQAFTQSILAGWLIGLMAWLLPFSGTARVLVIVALAWLVALGGFPHIIASAVDAFYAVLAGHVGAGHAFERFFAPALLGNMLGGLLLVTGINLAQATRRGRTGS